MKSRSIIWSAALLAVGTILSLLIVQMDILSLLGQIGLAMMVIGIAALAYQNPPTNIPKSALAKNVKVYVYALALLILFSIYQFTQSVNIDSSLILILTLFFTATYAMLFNTIIESAKLKNKTQNAPTTQPTNP